MIMGMWGIFGTTTVILLAGLKNMPRDLYEAATVDGAGAFGQFRNVTVPHAHAHPLLCADHLDDRRIAVLHRGAVHHRPRVGGHSS